MAKRILNRDELENIVYGSVLLGAGGGGSAANGLQLADEIKSGVTLLDPMDLPDHAKTVTVAGMGSPKVLLEKGFGVEAIYAYEAMKNMTTLGGVNITTIMPVELGGFNSIVPMYVAAAKNIPVIDADGCGRAVPELATTLFSAYKLPAWSPVTVANKAGDIVASLLTDPTDAAMAETVARTATISFGMIAGLASAILSMDEVKKYMVLNSVSWAEKVGKALQEAKARGADVVDAVSGAAGGKELFRGKIQKIEIVTKEGFDFGKTTIEGMGSYKGQSFVIDVKNENIIGWLNGKAVILVPDLITVLTLTGDPLTNADTKEGMEVGVIGIKAAKPWKNTPEGFNCWRHILDKMGYQEGYVCAL
jgi:DUF917 family protein